MHLGAVDGLCDRWALQFVRPADPNLRAQLARDQQTTIGDTRWGGLIGSTDEFYLRVRFVQRRRRRLSFVRRVDQREGVCIGWLPMLQRGGLFPRQTAQWLAVLNRSDTPLGSLLQLPEVFGMLAIRGCEHLGERRPPSARREFGQVPEEEEPGKRSGRARSRCGRLEPATVSTPSKTLP